MKVFADRQDAGRQLGAALLSYRDRSDVVVLGLPRGGVPVAAEVAEMLDAPLDIILARKLGLPFLPEVAMGAIAEGAMRFLDRALIEKCAVTEQELAEIETTEWGVLEAREAALRHGRRRLALAGRTVIVVDDGIATGATARVACESVRQLGAADLVLAVPVASIEALSSLSAADKIVCLSTPTSFRSVGEHYIHFTQTTDAEVIAALDEAVSRMADTRPGAVER